MSVFYARTVPSPARLVWLVAVTFTWLVLTAGCGQRPEISEHATLRLTTRELGPSSRFELVLDDPAASHDLLGMSAESPLNIDPPLPGTFVWRSRRAGIFTPTSPPQFGVRYTFSLRDGWRGADGRPVNARLRRAFDMPGLQVALERRSWWNEDDLPAIPTVVARFNAVVEPGELQRHARFTDGHESVPAMVEPFPELERPPATASITADTAGTSPPPKSPPTLRFLLRPEHPLASTNLWRFEITPGLSSATVHGRSTAVSSMPLGRAVPFALAEMEAANGVQGGRQVRLRFTRKVSPSLTTNDPSRWFHCDPPVTNLVVERSPGGHMLAVSGAFQLGTNYSVAVAAGLPGEEPVALRTGTNALIRFEPMAPTVWLTEFNTTQLGSGKRELEFLTLNTPETRIRVKAIDHHGLIPTLRAYERYLRSGTPFSPDTLPGSALDYAGIPGRTVHDRTLDTRAPIDTAVPHPLSWDRLVGPGSNGVFFVEADLHRIPQASGLGDTRVGPQAIVQLTDLGLLTKTGEKSTWVWVFSHTSARPLSGVMVSLRSDENVVLEEAMTDADGLARFGKPDSAGWVLAEIGGDLHAERLGDHAVPMWSFHLPGGWDDGPDTRLFAFTDREAFRPGETLHLKLLARTWQDERWKFPTNQVVQLLISGPRGDTAVRTNLALGPTGSADWTWSVPSGTRGTYQAHFECGSGRFEHQFEVRDFQPAAFEVSLAPKPSYGPGDLIVVPFAARYLFGHNLQHARLLWGARAEDFAFAPPGWTSFTFCQNSRDWRFLESQGNPGQVNADGLVDLDPTTTRLITPELPMNPVAPQPQRVQLTAEVTDLNQQTIASHREFVRHSSAFYLGFRWLHGDETVLATNAPLSFQLVAVRADGQPWPAVVEAKSRLRRIEWKSVAMQRAGRVIGYQNEAEFHDLDERTVRTQPVVRTGEQWATTDSAEAASFPALAEPGQYLLEFTARDEAGFTAMTTVEFHITGDGHLAWHRRNGAEVELVRDKATHIAGDTATLLVKSPFDATALVTVEREDVRRAFTVPLRGNTPAIQVPIGTNDSPNVFVSVALVRGSQGNPHAFPMPEWRVGYDTLSVPPEHNRLRVNVTTGAAVVRPGENVTVRATVRDATNDPVSGAEVTLYAVDEGYLVLKGTEAPQPFDAFTAPRRLGVTTTMSLPGLLPEDPEFRSFDNKGHVAGGGGRSVPPRRNMIPCPLWNVSLWTDKNGEVTASFMAPDSLTRYRVVAVATHGPCDMGTGVQAFEVRKTLMIESAMPRFAHVGDRLLARALVFNHSPRPLSARVGLVPGTNAVFALTNIGPVTINLPAEGTAVVEFPVLLRAPGASEWTWSVEAEALSDSVVTILPVTHAEAGLRNVRHLHLTAGTTDLLASADVALIEEPDTVALRLAASPIAFLGEGVHQLIHYPYGCVEQTGSSLLPWIALRDYPGLLPPEQRAATNIAAAVAAGVQRFWSMQTTDGGLAYWPGGALPQRWGSAYGAWILALARDGGAEVATHRMARLHQWLNEQWRADPPNPSAEVLNERCLTAFALAAGGKAEASLLESLWEARDRLAVEDRALLAVALLQSRNDHDAAKALLNKTPGKDQSPGLFGSDIRVNAIRLLAQSWLDPLSSETATLLASLSADQRGGHWGTTQGNAWALWALADQARSRGPTGRIDSEVRVGTVTHHLVAGPDNPVALIKLPLTSKDARDGLILEHHEPFPLYAEVTLSGRQPVGTNSPVAIDRGFALHRTYERLDSKNHPLPIAGLRVGDRVLVTLDLDAADPADWVAIEDPLPAVLEPVQGVFKTDGPAPSGLIDEWSSDFTEVRSDRMLIFRDALPEGRHRIRYLARVRAAGDVVAAPAKVEAMYQPQRHGFSEGVRLRADPADTGSP